MREKDGRTKKSSEAPRNNSSENKKNLYFKKPSRRFYGDNHADSYFDLREIECLAGK